MSKKIIKIGNEDWGPIAWNLIHNFSIKSKINDSMILMIKTFGYILPCPTCKNHYNYLINDIILILAIRISKTKGRLCNTISNQSLGAIPEAPPATHFSLPQRWGSGKNGAIPRVRHPKIMIFQLLYNDFIS